MSLTISSRLKRVDTHHVAKYKELKFASAEFSNQSKGKFKRTRKKKMWSSSVKLSSLLKHYQQIELQFTHRIW